MSRYDSSTWFRWTEERLCYLCEHYPTETNKSIADALGCSVSKVENKRRKLGLKKNKVWLSALHSKNLIPGQYKPEKGRKLTAETRAKISDTRRKLFKIERIRLKYGLWQRTKLKITNIY